MGMEWVKEIYICKEIPITIKNKKDAFFSHHFISIDVLSSSAIPSQLSNAHVLNS